jgi:DNA-binding HxlR family transcriptional regulator
VRKQTWQRPVVCSHSEHFAILGEEVRQEMASTSAYRDIKDAKSVVIKTLKEYGSMGYSRLLMSTGLPEDILEKSLNLLVNDKLVTRQDDADPQYRLAPSGLNNLWPFS